MKRSFQKPARRNFQVVIPPEWSPDLTPPSLRRQIPANFAVTTCDRPEIHATLASMYMGGFPADATLHLVISGSDDGYLSNYRHHTNVRLHRTEETEWEKVRGWPAKFRAGYNYGRCLSIQGYPGTLVCEDDIKFQNNWFAKWLRAVNDIERDGHERYILSLFPVRDVNTEKTYSAYPKMAWACSQAIYYPASVLPEIRDFIVNATLDAVTRLVQPTDPPFANAYDMLIKEYLLGSDIRLFCTSEALVQHVGRTSTGASGPDFIQSSRFLGS